jgi:hypothetical protein
MINGKKEERKKGKRKEGKTPSLKGFVSERKAKKRMWYEAKATLHICSYFHSPCSFLLFLSVYNPEVIPQMRIAQFVF